MILRGACWRLRGCWTSSESFAGGIVGEGELIVCGCGSPLPRATEHVQALYAQYEGLIESILDLEESIKRVRLLPRLLWPPAHSPHSAHPASEPSERSLPPRCRARRSHQARADGDLRSRADHLGEASRGASSTFSLITTNHRPRPNPKLPAPPSPPPSPLPRRTQQTLSANLPFSTAAFLLPRVPPSRALRPRRFPSRPKKLTPSRRRRRPRRLRRRGERRARRRRLRR